MVCGPHCFFQKAKRQAREATVVIMNHALFFTLFAMQDAEEYFLFKDDFVIFDEAQTLESVAGLGIGKSISRAQVLFAVHRLYNPKTKKGLLAKHRSKHHKELCAQAERATNAFFEEVQIAVRALSEKSTTLRIRTPRFVSDTLSRPLQQLRSAVREVEDDEKSKVAKDELVAAKRLIGEAEMLVEEFLEQSDSALTYWVELSSGRFQNVHLNTAPTSVADSIAPKLFKKGTSVIMTSATLSVNGSLAYFQQRLGAYDARTLILDTPFDYQKQMRLLRTIRPSRRRSPNGSTAPSPAHAAKRSSCLPARICYARLRNRFAAGLNRRGSDYWCRTEEVRGTHCSVSLRTISIPSSLGWTVSGWALTFPAKHSSTSSSRGCRLQFPIIL